MELVEDLRASDRRILLNGDDLDGVFVADDQQVRCIVHAITTAVAAQVGIVGLGGLHGGGGIPLLPSVDPVEREEDSVACDCAVVHWVIEALRHHKSARLDVTDVDAVCFLVSHISDRQLRTTALRHTYMIVGMPPTHADAALFLEIVNLTENLLFEDPASARPNDHVSCP